MSGLKKIFGDANESCIDKLYESVDDVAAKKVVMKLPEQKSVSFDEVQQAIKKLMAPIDTVNKSCLVNIDEIDLAEVDKRVRTIVNIKKDVQTAVIEAIKVNDYDNVKYYPAELVQKDGKPAVYRPPRFVINLESQDIQPHQGVRINTGYVFRIPTYCMGKTIQNNKIVDTSISKQINYVVVPIICSKNHGIIPTIYARDPNDTGMLTINFTTTAKFDKKSVLQVILMAYSVSNPNLGVNLINPVDGSPGLFKNKDSAVGRYVRNPKVKFYAAKMEVSDGGRAVEFPTFDNNVKPVKEFEKQRLRISDMNALIVSRKREWFSENLVSVAGLFMANDMHYTPIIADGSDIANNTHCLVFINKRITLFDVPGTMNDDILLLNGAFSNNVSYKMTIAKLRAMANAMHGLSVGVETCKDVVAKNPDIKLENLLKLYDYNRGIKSNDPKLLEKTLTSERQMFEERTTCKIPYSAEMHKAMMYLAKILFNERLCENEKVVVAEKIDDDDDELPKVLDKGEDVVDDHPINVADADYDDEIPAKRIKL